MTLPLTIELSNSKLLPIWFTVIVLLRTLISFNVFGFLQPISYLVIGFLCINFLLIGLMFIKSMEMSQYGLVAFVYMAMILVFSIIHGTDFITAFYEAIEVYSLLCIFAYYSHRWKLILCTICVVCSVAVYANLALMLIFPDWMFAADDEFDSFILGGNYNQLGCRMMCALVSSVLCIPYSKKWIINLIGVSFVSIVTLLIVGSMTSLSNIILFSLLCLIPSRRLLKLALISFFTFYVLFQCFVCFQGEGLHNNELATYIIQDVLGKDLTFTNRTEMWDAAAKVFAQSPIIGWGRVDAEWYTTVMSSFAIGPHNYIYSVLIYGGIVGFGIFLLSAFIAVRHIWGYMDRTALILLLGTVTFMFMMCFEVYKSFFVFYLFAMIYYYRDFYKRVNEEEEAVREENV